jgi:hypothetical protein
MLVTFRSTATPDVLMLKDLAQYLLGLVGKHLSPRGVILHDELPAAISRLEAAITADETTQAEQDALYQHGHVYAAGEQHGGLSRRAWPFLDMMREAERQNADIIWGL